ncbi:predicted protein [Naegleria gruberi]|uniref:Predicted protein n=1 Tax=Naegleria gruberi TaxID=5762 RepID=D2UY45_NAEGR|nr:uncharacterized protein NAEGRDRAFT_61341 [Naegleria gruberi]EFC50730.1 predicted protein [Naegleria gruberi]|eukprot:XP_002683474.1 predicted protein [Naegleria gruberi strain NEG-M]
MNILNANFLSPSRPVITPKKDLNNNLSPFNIFSSTKQSHPQPLNIGQNTSLEEAWALRVKQIQQESDPNFIHISYNELENPSSPQPITPFTINNSPITCGKNIYPPLQTPTPFRKHLSDDVEKYKKHISSEEHTPSNGHTPFLQGFTEDKPITVSISPPPLSKATSISICENLITSPNHFSPSTALSPFKETTFIFNGVKENFQNERSLKKNISPSNSIDKGEIQQTKVIACELLHSGFLENAVEKALECKQMILKHLGSFNEDLIYIFILLGESLTHLAKFKQAKLYLLEAKKIVDGLFKSKHNNRVLALFSIQIYNDLGYLMKLQGKYKHSIEYYRKHLLEKQKYYHVNTNEIATAYTQLGVVYSLVGSFENSMECLCKALEIREKIFGRDHLETATVYNNIGNVFLYVADYHKAYQYYRLGEGILESNSLIDHPDYATSLVNLATCLKSLKQTEEAIILYEKALNIRERILGERHSSTVSCYLMIGSLYITMQEFEKADEYLYHGIMLREIEFGKDHIETAVGYLYIGNLRQEMGKFEEALSFYNKAKEIYVKHYGDTHTETILVFENISSLLLNFGKGDEAMDLLYRVLKHKQQYYGDNHPSTGTVLNNIGNILRQQGKIIEAFEKYQKCKAIFESSFGFDHEATAVIYTNLGHLYLTSFLNNQKDEKLVREILQQKSTSIDDSKIRELKITEALRLYTHAKSIRERLFGTNHIDTIISQRNISIVYATMKNYPLAYQHICSCKKLLALHHANNEVEMKETSKVMADILRDSGGKVKKVSGDSILFSSPSIKSQVNQRNMNKAPSLSALLDGSISIRTNSLSQRSTLYHSSSKNRSIKSFR